MVCWERYCTKLGYAKPQNALRDNVDEGDARKQGISDANNHTQQMVIINEAGLYSLIFGSKLESAKKFKRWVTSEVLPSLRKTGSYGTNQLLMTTDEKIQLLAQGNIELKEEIKQVDNKVNDVKADLEALKMDLPLLPIEADKITCAVKKKGVELLGGKLSNAYNNRNLRQRVYNDIYANLKYNFGIKSYKSLKRKQTEAALNIINCYKPPYFLAEEIKNYNAQQTLI